ncbi:MAG: hypothetical protein J0H67_08675 [Rhodospirillales bacterium]|nr:hypothetical protein [Rhodospirillales bacterium]MBN8897639.1 hypothetical protein [Rhodospirillales bacterium]
MAQSDGLYLRGAAAQSAQTRPPVPATPPPSAQPGPTTTPPEQVAPGGRGTLSDQLSKGQGTLTPPKVDPDIARKPPATTGNMPVIPPPGTAGGNSSVVPK